jgi:hypothetical protein
MTRRRLILAACVAVVALGAGWWLCVGGLSTEEQYLVGTWYSTSGTGTWVFEADQSGRYQHRHPIPTLSFPAAYLYDDFRETWFLRGGAILLDCEQSEFRRAFRPLLRFLGRRPKEIMTFTLVSIIDDEMVVIRPDGSREMWTRDLRR